jgi:hypothetical protein
MRDYANPKSAAIFYSFHRCFMCSWTPHRWLRRREFDSNDKVGTGHHHFNLADYSS